MKINKQKITGGQQQFANKIVNNTIEERNKKSIENIQESSFQLIKNLISKGEIAIAVDQLFKICPNNEIEKELLLIKSKMSSLSRDKNLELESFVNIQITKSNLILAILDIIDRIEKK